MASTCDCSEHCEKLNPTVWYLAEENFDEVNELEMEDLPASIAFDPNSDPVEAERLGWRKATEECYQHWFGYNEKPNHPYYMREGHRSWKKAIAQING